jgi:hypothetical protein
MSNRRVKPTWSASLVATAIAALVFTDPRRADADVTCVDLGDTHYCVETDFPWGGVDFPDPTWDAPLSIDARTGT